MKPEEHLTILSELIGEVCQLNHKNDPDGVPQASNVLVVPIGYKKNDVESVAVREITIFVCEECAESLSNEDDWVLIYCLGCCESQWINKKLSKLSYANHLAKKDHKVIWLDSCPHCSEKTRGVWFG